MKTNKLRTHLFLAFSILTVIFIATLLGSAYFYNKRNKTTESIRKIDDERVRALKIFKLVDDFITFETKNVSYFKTEKSRIKDEIEKDNALLIRNLTLANNNFPGDKKQVRRLIDSILARQEIYFRNFLETEKVILKKGFKDYGAEGNMRRYAHELMEIKNLHIENEVLMLRRHEKDFIIRHEKEYYLKFYALCDTLVLKGKKTFTVPTEYDNFERRLLNYRKYFKEYCDLQEKIGLNENVGLLYRLDADYKIMDGIFDTLKSETISIEANLHEVLKLYNLFLIIITIFVSVLFSLYYSRRISRSANIVKEMMNRYVLSGFTDRPKNAVRLNIAELDMIASNFLRMAGEIDGYVNFFKVKVEERTNEIRIQKEEIELQRHKIQVQRDLLIEQKFLLAEKNKNLTDSIVYAQKIQKAMLPDLHDFKSVFSDCFIFYEAKDIVSGDFFWIETIAHEQLRKKSQVMQFADTFGGGAIPGYNATLEEKNKSNKTVIVAVADCTGHGVPGAFMSIMGINHLNKICREHKVINPPEILSALNFEIGVSLKQAAISSSVISDGMDIGCCAIDFEKNTLSFAGANKKLWLVRNGELEEYAGDNFPIGNHNNGNTAEFRETKLTFKKGDAFYLFSDGYQDQFGGPERKKFKSKNLKKILTEISDFPMADQGSIIRKTFNEWRGETFQVDDVTVIGIRI